MQAEEKSVLLLSMPFAGIAIPSIQLPVIAGYLEHRGITVHTRHLYLQAASIYGLQNYNALISPPNDSYTAQLGFSKHLFPEHWEKTQNVIRSYYEQHIAQHEPLRSQCPFDTFVQRTQTTYDTILQQIDWTQYDIIGFTLNYGQLNPSLAIAKAVKERHPEKHIILGGSRTMEMLGVNILKAFPFIDFAVSGEGEDALYKLAIGDIYSSIPGLIYRDNETVRWNPAPHVIDLDATPIPSYDSFYEQLTQVSDDIQKYYYYYGRLPVEISRGCWWNHCTFCNLNVHHPRYREKSVRRIVEEIQTLSDRYKILEFQLIGNTLPRSDYRTFFEQLRSLGRDFSFVVEARAGELTSQDYDLMKHAGFTIIQTGIESFSPHYLKKMKKGTRVIDNIAALKFCKENEIQNHYNLIVNYPNEDARDFEETQQIIRQIHSYLDPPQLCELRVMYGSPIQRFPEQFNIKTLMNAPIDRIMYPPPQLDQGVAFVYDFERTEPYEAQDWDALITEWKQTRERAETDATRSKATIDRLVFFFVDGGTFLKVYDKREPQNVRIFVLNDAERTVFLACVDVVSIQELKERIPWIPEFELIAILQSFEQNGLVIEEDKQYLCLPLRYQEKRASKQTEAFSEDIISRPMCGCRSI
jgi:ribosomal peptide maturation radical SAM protein 1